MTTSAQTDHFVHDRLAPAAQWSQLRYDLPELQQQQQTPQLDLVGDLLDQATSKGFAERPLLCSPTPTLTFGEVRERVDYMAQLLTEDLGLAPGNQVQLRGGNSIDMAVAWPALVKAGLVAVANMPLLRAKELFISSALEKASARWWASPTWARGIG